MKSAPEDSSIGTFQVVGYVPDGRRIEALLVAEPSSKRLRPVGRTEFRLPGVLDDDARAASREQQRGGGRDPPSRLRQYPVSATKKARFPGRNGGP